MNAVHLLASDGGQVIVVMAVAGGLIIAIISIIGNFVMKAKRSADLTRTQREIAAYVAEGSMTPEEGERLMRAASEAKPSEGCC